MRYRAGLLLVAAACGEVAEPLADAPAGTPDAPGGSGDGPSPDGRVDAVGACTTYAGTWVTNGITFDGDIAPTARVTFETRGDGVTGVTAGTPVPPDEYMACCGIRLEFIGPTGGGLIWAGNAASGFEVRATCPSGPCLQTSGVRVTFASPVTAIGYEYPGGTDARVLDAAGGIVSSMSVMGSGTNFLGYESAVPLQILEATDGGGENLNTLLYHRCP